MGFDMEVCTPYPTRGRTDGRMKRKERLAMGGVHFGRFLVIIGRWKRCGK